MVSWERGGFGAKSRSFSPLASSPKFPLFLFLRSSRRIVAAVKGRDPPQGHTERPQGAAFKNTTRIPRVDFRERNEGLNFGLSG